MKAKQLFVFFICGVFGGGCCQNKVVDEVPKIHDPNNVIPNIIKETIQSALMKNGEAKSNEIFAKISDWDVPEEAREFVKESMLLMSENIEVKKEDASKRTPLMLAAEFGEEKAVVKLIKRGAEIGALDIVGYTSLHWAAMSGNEACCNLLLRNGADINAKNKFGSTSLMRAAWFGYVKVVQILLMHGADTKLRDDDGETALNQAAQNCVYVILAHEARQRISNI